MPEAEDKLFAFGDNIELIGYLRKDSMGRLFIDKCATDEEHLTQQTKPGVERPGCRRYLSDFIPDEFDGAKVAISLDIGIRRLRT